MLLPPHTTWALKSRFPQQTIEKILGAAVHHSTRTQFRSIQLTFFWSWLWCQTKHWTTKAECSPYNKTAVQNCLGCEKVHLSVRCALGLACAWVAFWPELIKKAEVGEHKNNLWQVCLWGESAIWCELGSLASPLAASILTNYEARFPAQVSHGNRLEKTSVRTQGKVMGNVVFHKKGTERKKETEKGTYGRRKPIWKHIYCARAAQHGELKWFRGRQGFSYHTHFSSQSSPLPTHKGKWISSVYIAQDFTFFLEQWLHI